MHGNVAEWCRDFYRRYSDAVRDGDGLRLPDRPFRLNAALATSFDPSESCVAHVIRGGSYMLPVNETRSARRYWVHVGDEGSAGGWRDCYGGGDGVRPARALHP